MTADPSSFSTRELAVQSEEQGEMGNPAPGSQAQEANASLPNSPAQVGLELSNAGSQAAAGGSRPRPGEGR